MYLSTIWYGITSAIHYDGEALKLSCCKDITNYVTPSLTDVVFGKFIQLQYHYIVY